MPSAIVTAITKEGLKVRLFRLGFSFHLFHWFGLTGFVFLTLAGQSKGKGKRDSGADKAASKRFQNDAERVAVHREASAIASWTCFQVSHPAGSQIPKVSEWSLRRKSRVSGFGSPRSLLTFSLKEIPAHL
jgi:hypothetical protein